MPPHHLPNVRFLAGIATLILLVLLILLTWSSVESLRLENQNAVHVRILTSIVNDIHDRLGRTRAVTEILSSDPLLASQARGEFPPDEPRVKASLETSRRIVDGSIGYVMDTQGVVMASTDQASQSLTGKRYEFRPYFLDAMNKGEGIYPAVGVTTGERGLYVSHALYHHGETCGVVVLKMNVEPIDLRLSLYHDPVALVSPEGVMFSANRPGWTLGVLPGITAAYLESIRRSRQFADAPLRPVPLQIKDGVCRWESGTWNVHEKAINLPGWRVFALLSPRAQERQLTDGQRKFITVVFSLLVLMTLVLGQTIRSYLSRWNLENRHASLLQNSPDGICVSQKERICFANPALAAITGKSIAELSGQKLLSFIHPEDRHLVEYQESNHHDLNTDTVDALPVQPGHVLRLNRADGTIRNIRFNSITTSWGDQPATLEYIRDITEMEKNRSELDEYRKNLEAKVASRTVELQDAIRVAQEMASRAEAASRAKSEFLANISHELRTPLNGVLGMLRLLLEGEINGDQREFAETARISAEELLVRIDQILDFARIEAGRVEIMAQSFDPRELLESVSASPFARARKKGLKCTIEVEAGIPVKLMGDPLRMRQILLQLLDNAVRFTNTGSIALEMKRVEDRLYCCEVTDTGIGVPADLQEKIFEPFTQGDGSLTRTAGGFGLGLTVATRLAEVMGGRIELESGSAQGSIFKVFLPLAADVSRLEQKVLLLETDRTSQTILLGMVKKTGFTGVIASSAADMTVHLESGGVHALIVAMEKQQDLPVETLKRWKIMHSGLIRILMGDCAVPPDGYDQILKRPPDAESLDRLLRYT